MSDDRMCECLGPNDCRSANQPAHCCKLKRGRKGDMLIAAVLKAVKPS